MRDEIWVPLIRSVTASVEEGSDRAELLGFDEQ